jgi:hypothetical protein
MSSEQLKYNGIPQGMLIEGTESAEAKKALAAIVKHGMNFSREKIKDATSISLQIDAQRPVFVDYLAYVVFGRIVRLSTQCPEDKKEVCVSVKFAHGLGEYINGKVAKSRNGFKQVDFTQEGGRVIIQQAFETINADHLFDQLGEQEIDMVRRFGSMIIPENPKPGEKPSTWRLE